MSLPDPVQSVLDDEPVAASVDLGDDDELHVTPTRTLVYRAEGILSEESVEELPHDAERVAVSEGRRKSEITLGYGLDGERTVAIRTDRLDEALHPVLAGVLNAAGITEAGETVEHTFRFSELTLVVTSARVVKHIGPEVWDEEFEEFHYDDVTDLAFEEGSVATTAVLTVDGRQERFKTPTDRARAVREALQSTLFAYYDVSDLDALRDRAAGATDADGAPDAGGTVGADADAFGGGPDPLGADPADLTEEPANAPTAGDEDGDATGGNDPDRPAAADDGFEGSAFESAGADSGDDGADGGDVPTDGSPDDGAQPDGVAGELAALRAAVEEQNERLRTQEELLDRLVDELRRGR